MDHPTREKSTVRRVCPVDNSQKTVAPTAKTRGASCETDGGGTGKGKKHQRLGDAAPRRLRSPVLGEDNSFLWVPTFAGKEGQ